MKLRKKCYHYILFLFFIFTLNRLFAQGPIVINHSNWDPSVLCLDLLNEIRQQHIMFGHQSVGLNIVEGLEMLATNDQERYSLTILNNPAELNQPALYRWINGENYFPEGKIDSFVTKMESKDAHGRIWAEVASIAYFKFCYIDFNSLEIDINSIYERYIASMESLMTAYSNCMFVHVTVPLTAIVWSSDKERNVNRHKYNEMIRAYVDSTGGLLFDLADLEAHDENENYQFFEYKGETYPMMWYDENDPYNNGYSYDGGHLNDKGKLHMASAMWSLWGRIINKLVPVELIQFKANVIDEGVKLSWITASESNNFAFEVERSIDNNNFEKIGFIKGNGTSISRNSYSFIDVNPPFDTVYYRLIQKDFDGTIKVYSTIKVHLEKMVIHTFQLFQNFPNPYNNSTKIEFIVPKNQYVKLEVFDSNGRNILKPIRYKQMSGRNTISLDARHLASGIYFYKLEAGDHIEVKKMIIIK